MVTKDTKKTTKKIVKVEKKEKMFQAIGRRKEAVARVRFTQSSEGKIIVNDQAIESYFPGEWMKSIYLTPLKTCNVIDKYFISIKVKGSGKMGQLGAVVHGMSRVLSEIDEEKFKQTLRRKGFLTRDPRAKERRKTGTGGKARRQKQSPKR